MMLKSVIFCIVFLILASPAKSRGDNGGIPCATCTILLSISSQLAQIYNETTVDSLSRLCTYLPQTYQTECQSLVGYLAPVISEEIDLHLTVDTVCYTLGVCYVDPGRQMCHLFPLPPDFNPLPKSSMASFDEKKFIRAFPWVCYLPGIYRLCEALSDTYKKLLPAVDIDGDKYVMYQYIK